MFIYQKNIWLYFFIQGHHFIKMQEKEDNYFVGFLDAIIPALIPWIPSELQRKACKPIKKIKNKKCRLSIL